jgi:uncharacterized membrane protein
MTLIMSTSSCSLYIYSVYTRLFSLQLGKIFRIPLLIGIFMLGVFVLLKQLQIEFYVKLISAILAYCLLAGLILVVKNGGIKSSWRLLKTAKK